MSKEKKKDAKPEYGKYIGVHLDLALVDELHEYCQAEGKKLKYVVGDAVRAYLAARRKVPDNMDGSPLPGSSGQGYR